MSAISSRKCRALVLLALAPAAAVAAPGNLENPAPGQPVSGIGTITGWACDARRIEASVDGGALFTLPYGSSRLDTAPACGGRGDNGFGYLINWNLLPTGEHTIRVLVDGVELARRTFLVASLGAQFIIGKGPRTVVADFPKPGQALVLEWQESSQNFVIAQLRQDGPTLNGRWNGADLERRSGCRSPQNDGNHGTYVQTIADIDRNDNVAIDTTAVTGLACSYRGRAIRDPAGMRIVDGALSCSDGKSGTFESTGVLVTDREMSIQMTVKLQGSESCSIDKTLGGSKY